MPEIITDSAKYHYPTLGDVSHLPYSIRILVENLLRHGHTAMAELVKTTWGEPSLHEQEIPFSPSRVLLQDFTGVPAVVDLAAMRDAVSELGGDPKCINPLVPVDLVVDHSVQVDAYGSDEALSINTQREFERNRERYEFLRWGQKAFANFRVVPPATGIVHQVNLEYLASVVTTRETPSSSHLERGRMLSNVPLPKGDNRGLSAHSIFPDTLVGTDSHTTMINSLGVLGWGVGGIEAEAAMLGQPVSMLVPRVVGVRLEGELQEGVTATDLVLTVTQVLRAHGVVEQFVEFFGPAVKDLPLADRATIANMAPEYGATVGFFPPDAETIRYLVNTGRNSEQVHLAERYLRAQNLFVSPPSTRGDQGGSSVRYSEIVIINLSDIEPSVAGPTRPQDRVGLKDVKKAFYQVIASDQRERSQAEHDPAFRPGNPSEEIASSSPSAPPRNDGNITHGSVLIAAITSCTNTSNPSVMLGAGLLARNALKRGLRVPPYVKTSLAPGSKVVKTYLENAGLLCDLETLGFNIVGYGCTTCIGNSGPIDETITKTVEENALVTASVLSGNRNFEGRVHPLTRVNFLASPPLVVAYALAGTVDIDLTQEPIGHDISGLPVFLRDVWPSGAEVQSVMHDVLKPELYRTQYGNVFDGNKEWSAIPTGEGDRYAWQQRSTYIRRPTFLENIPRDPHPIASIAGARVLALLGDSVTTDHISPAGSISKTGAAADYLRAHGIEPRDFNSYGARRGNHEVMVRGTFANVRLKNLLAPGTEGGVTIHLPSGETMTIFDAAERYRKENIPLIIIAGKDYGMGSSRDWAGKGPALLGVRAVLFESVERIHRSNLIGMGILPLEFLPGQNPSALGLTGHEIFSIHLDETLRPSQTLTVQADGNTFDVTCRIDSSVELDYFRHGGILPYVLRGLL